LPRAQTLGNDARSHAITGAATLVDAALIFQAE
jgi:hypothetical protein